MKMKKCLTLTAVLALAVGSAQAASYSWGDGQFGIDEGGVWDASSSWMLNNAGLTTTPPGSGDDVKISEFVFNATIPVMTMPTLGYDAGTVNWLMLGEEFAGTSSLTISSGGNLTSALTGIGWQAGSVGTIDMTGGTHSTAALYIGYTGDGTVNLSGDALLDVTGAGAVAWGAAGGSASMTMDGDSMFRILGDQTGAGWENNLVTAVGAGDSIDVNFVGGATEYTVIPEPATLGLVAAFGGAILFIRRKFMI